VTFLLDINVLVALFDAAHIHHEPAHRWFSSIGLVSWATCPLTENGFIRVISNPAYKGAAASPEEAGHRLRVFCAQPGHVFWPDSISIQDAVRFELSRLQGHQQITDLYLAGLAAANVGKLATFDAHIPISALCNAGHEVLAIIPVT
jgi:uncharacterized protein